MAVPAEAAPVKSRPQSVTTLNTIVELVRRIMHADVTSVVSFSLSERTITWKVASGLRAHVIDAEHPLVRPITNEAALRAIVAQTTLVLDGIREGIIVHDEEMRIIRCNALAAEMMNLQPAEVVGLSFSDAFARLFGKRAAGYYLAERRQPTSAFEVQAEDERRYLVSIFPVTQTSGNQVSVVTWNDVTRMSEMQEQLARSRRLASVGQLAAGVAHEINNPLAAITTCAEATMRDIRRDSETQALAESHQWTYYLEEIVRQALRCKDITRGLLDLTRQRQAQRAQ